VVFQKGKGLYRLTSVDRVTEHQIHFDGRCHVPKTTYRSWNTLLLRIATDEDKQKFDKEWRRADGKLQHPPGTLRIEEPQVDTHQSQKAQSNLQESFFVIRRKSDGKFFDGCGDDTTSWLPNAWIFTTQEIDARLHAQVTKYCGEWEWLQVRATYEFTAVGVAT